MSRLYFEKKGRPPDRGEELYKCDTPYEDKRFRELFLELKSRLIDLGSAAVAKAITGTQADFVLLMDRASDYIRSHFDVTEEEKKSLLGMFQESVFGYYVLDPLIKSREISDITVTSWDHVTVKIAGERYVSTISFFSEADYSAWYLRMLRRLGGTDSEEFPLQELSDRSGAEDFYLRVDIELSGVNSSGNKTLHIRKTPKEKYSWEYLTGAGMLDDTIKDYLIDRILAGYSFLLSGCGASGKTSLLNTLLDEIPRYESGLIVQDHDELYSYVQPHFHFEHTISIPLESGEVKEVTLEDLLRLGLLQDIDNFIIGEIKGGEALNVFTTAMSTGARFMGTIHSNDARSSIRRMAHLARYVSDYPVEALEEMISETPFSLVHMDHFKVDEIYEVTGWDEEGRRLLYKEVYKRYR